MFYAPYGALLSSGKEACATKKNSSLWSFHPTNIKYLRLTAINSTGLLFTNTFRSFSRGIKQEFRDYRARPLSLLLSNFPVRPSSPSPLMIEAPRPVSEGRERERRRRRRSSARPKGTSNIILLAPLLSVRRLMLGGIRGRRVPQCPQKLISCW